MARPPSRSDAGLLAAYLRPEQAQLLVLGMVLVVAMLMPVAGPVLLGRAIDAALAGDSTTEIVRLAAAFLVVTVGSDALQVLVAYRSVGLAWRVGNRLRLDLARHALRLDLDWHGRHSAGLLIERIDGDVAAIVEFSSVAVLQLLGNAILVVGVLVVSFLIDWRAGLLILGSVTVASYLLIRLRSVAVPAHDAEREIQSDLYGDLEERLGGLEDLRSLDAGEYVVHRLEHHSSRWWHAARRAALLGDGAYTAAATAFSLGSVLTLGVGVALQRNGVITLGSLLAVFRFSQMVRQPIERIAEQMREFQKAVGRCPSGGAPPGHRADPARRPRRPPPARAAAGGPRRCRPSPTPATPTCSSTSTCTWPPAPASAWSAAPAAASPPSAVSWRASGT